MQESSKSSTDYLNDTTDSKALRWELVIKKKQKKKCKSQNPVTSVTHSSLS